MSDKYRIDGHKLMFHVDRVNAWLQGDLVYPIYIEISPSGACNHRCTYCALDFMEYQPRFLDTAILTSRIGEMGQKGVRSIMFAGEGEPFLHKDMATLISRTRQAGIDVAITTNGVLLVPDIAEDVLRASEWIKVSINAGTAQTYAKIHRTQERDFDRVIHNLAYAVEVKRSRNYSCALGMQLLLLPENHAEVVSLARQARDLGMDYLVVKPYSQHPQSKTTTYQQMRYNEFYPLAEELAELNDEHFSVIFRLDTMRKWDEKGRYYERCLGLPFWSYLDAGGNIWGCSMYMRDDRFWYGNIYENTFAEIWEGSRRNQSREWFEKEFCPQQCRVNCRMDQVNQYLWQLKHPPEHVNFI